MAAAGSAAAADLSAQAAAAELGVAVKFVSQTLTPEQQAVARENIGMAGETQVSSFNGRAGAVVPMSNDYTADMVGALPDDTTYVASFNGRTGAVTPQANDYSKSDVGLGNVDNTSDTDKPVSVNQRKAIDGNEAKTTVFNVDGSITETYTDRSKTTVFNADGTITETTHYQFGDVAKKTTFNADGSITEEIL